MEAANTIMGVGRFPPHELFGIGRGVLRQISDNVNIPLISEQIVSQIAPNAMIATESSEIGKNRSDSCESFKSDRLRTVEQVNKNIPHLTKIVFPKSVNPIFSQSNRPSTAKFAVTTSNYGPENKSTATNSNIIKKPDSILTSSTAANKILSNELLFTVSSSSETTTDYYLANPLSNPSNPTPNREVRNWENSNNIRPLLAGVAISVSSTFAPSNWPKPLDRSSKLPVISTPNNIEQSSEWSATHSSYYGRGADLITKTWMRVDYSGLDLTRKINEDRTQSQIVYGAILLVSLFCLLIQVYATLVGKRMRRTAIRWMTLQYSTLNILYLIIFANGCQNSPWTGFLHSEFMKQNFVWIILSTFFAFQVFVSTPFLVFACLKTDCKTLIDDSRPFQKTKTFITHGIMILFNVIYFPICAVLLLHNNTTKMVKNLKFFLIVSYSTAILAIICQLATVIFISAKRQIESVFKQNQQKLICNAKVDLLLNIIFCNLTLLLQTLIILHAFRNFKLQLTIFQFGTKCMEVMALIMPLVYVLGTGICVQMYREQYVNLFACREVYGEKGRESTQNAKHSFSKALRELACFRQYFPKKETTEIGPQPKQTWAKDNNLTCSQKENSNEKQNLQLFSLPRERKLFREKKVDREKIDQKNYDITQPNQKNQYDIFQNDGNNTDGQLRVLQTSDLQFIEKDFQQNEEMEQRSDKLNEKQQIQEIEERKIEEMMSQKRIENEWEESRYDCPQRYGNGVGYPINEPHTVANKKQQIRQLEERQLAENLRQKYFQANLQQVQMMNNKNMNRHYCQREFSRRQPSAPPSYASQDEYPPSTV